MTKVDDDDKWLALSSVQDECTLCNRWFDTYAEAAAYTRETKKESGCILYVICVRKGEKK